MDINDLETDELITMTKEMHRAFNAVGCDPACHCCGVKIPVGEQYKFGHVTLQLAMEADREFGPYEKFKPFKTDKGHEVMLCKDDLCTPEAMVLKAQEEKRRYYEKFEMPVARRGGCSIINGKLVA